MKSLQQRQQENRNKHFSSLQEQELKEAKLRTTMEKKYKDITGRTDEEKTYDLKNEEDVNKIIKQLE